ncbi:hypothetical protein D3C76_1081450 [compost metagenome]
MITGIDAVAEIVFNRQVLQLQAGVLRPEDGGTHYPDGGTVLALATVKHVPGRFARHVFTARIDQTTPGRGIHLRVDRQTNFHINRFFTRTVQGHATRRGRHIHGAFVLAW